ncbi:hypothetical protein BDN72DRAFT_763451, partial [Pluteus cervinus]
MLSCRDLYKIAERLAEVLKNAEVPFGGMNMLFAGDFAQLPPAIGGEYASLYTREISHTGTTLPEQKKAMGKALWHQVTTVVILRQNMRQNTESDDDAKFRTALGNMRYKSCTKDDIDFLRTRIHNPYDPKRPKITDEQFRNASIIVSYNITKDTINNLGCTRFAKETGQDLNHFYSEDSVYVPDLDNMKPRKRKKYKLSSNIPSHVQKWLWQQPTCACDKHIPGCLSLCIGMPVMIRINQATELCITKGQEGFVHNWVSGKGTKGQDVLYTLFVRLANPPRNIQFEGLPQNVVPIYRTTTRVMVSLPLGPDIPVSRTQVEVLPNFSMTDYSSQGKTRPANPVDLSNSRTHQHVYTALSRSSTAAGTLILQRLDAPTITGGPSGALRQ